MKTNLFLLVVLLGASVGCSTTKADSAPASTSAETASASQQPLDPQALGRELTAQFYAGETAAIWSRMTEKMQSALGSEANLATFRRQVEAQLGTETAVLDETVSEAPPYQVYLRTASFSNFDKPVAVQWALDDAGNVAGFFVKPAQ